MEYGNIDSVPELEYLPALSNLLQDGFILYGPDPEDPQDGDHCERIDERTGQTEIFDSIEEVEDCITDLDYSGRFKIIRITPNGILSLEKVVDV
jgi:hypothetical protein